jgi:hypothetical protein
MQDKLARLAKWNLHRFYSGNPQIARYLPPTAILAPGTLSSFLDKHGTVYIKANRQHTGKGIMKAWKTPFGYKFVKVRGKAIFAPSKKELFNKVRNTSPHQTFLIQKAINLAEVNHRPYDIRVMMMRDGKRIWHYAGMAVKVAGRGSVICNVLRGGGYVTSIENALTQSKFNSAQIKRIKKELIDLSYRIIHYSEKFPFFSFQSGIDLAVDKAGRVWIIEVNLHNPSHGLFKKLENKTFYRRIGWLYTNYRRHNKRVI